VATQRLTFTWRMTCAEAAVSIKCGASSKPGAIHIYVLHCFKKKTPKTSLKDKELTTQRYKKMLLSRIKT